VTPPPSASDGHILGGGTIPPDKAQQLPAAQLAYIGDAVYELYIRMHFLRPLNRIQVYHSQVVSHVRAECQAEYLADLLPFLTPVEQDIVRRGRNAASNRPRRLRVETYGQATGLEALVGYLYLSDPQRLQDVLRQLPLTELS
jgi:ribonuclease III family protein